MAGLWRTGLWDTGLWSLTQVVFGTAYVNTNTFGTGQIIPGPVTITGTLYTDPDSFGTGTVSASYTITGALFVDPDGFGIGRVVYTPPVTEPSPGTYLLVPAEIRTLSAQVPEDRTLLVPGEVRVLSVPAETRFAQAA